VHRVPVEDADGQRAACEPEPEAILVLAPLGERAPCILAAVQLAVLGLDRARAMVCSAHDQTLAGGAATHIACDSLALTSTCWRASRARKFCSAFPLLPPPPLPVCYGKDNQSSSGRPQGARGASLAWLIKRRSEAKLVQRKARRFTPIPARWPLVPVHDVLPPVRWRGRNPAWVGGVGYGGWGWVGVGVGGWGGGSWGPPVNKRARRRGSCPARHGELRLRPSRPGGAHARLDRIRPARRWE
jgi:hypothetical protein